MTEMLSHPLVFYSPPLRVVAAAGPKWTYETLVVGRDGKARRLPSHMDFPDAEGRKACAAHVVAQMRVDREAARKRGAAAVGLVAVFDLASWEDLLLAHGLSEAKEPARL
ncbi:hypothetical protein L2U69_02690 [Zavarzinia compransoris]|uniref:hypothetical protein n=1 Tax=Zavarzinia marina TaxID=2911065 RepID=UPI001F1D55D5|nr:hypothetical protein [Zavarzinia marina]MCF4164554.1 hypothetical protein [Zavarzinia marina]